jgi:hypothetical protein
MHWGTRSLGALFRRKRRRGPKKARRDDSERSFRHIWNHLVHASDKRYPPDRHRPNAIVLQIGKVASTSINAALNAHGINAFHCHRLSPEEQRVSLNRLLQGDVTVRLASRDLRRHFQRVALHTLTRWYEQHKCYQGQKLKVVTLTRDPVTRYPSGFVRRWKTERGRFSAWHSSRPGAHLGGAEAEEITLRDFMAEVASIVAEGRPSEGPTGIARCLALARERWPDHSIVATELAHLLVPMTWFDREIGGVFGLDLFAGAELRERGWAVRSNDWVDILVLRFEDLASLLPEMARFFNLPELTLPRKNITARKSGAAEVAEAWKAALATTQTCARELRASSYGRACGYDRLA